MTLQQIMNLNQRQIESMTRKELAKVVSTMRSVVQKRIARLESTEVYSPAYSAIMTSGGIPTVKGMDVTALRNEYKRYKHFIGLKTSTVKGAKRYQEISIKNFEKLVGTGYSTNEIKHFFSLLDDLREEGLVTEKNYNQSLQYMVDYSNEHGTVSDAELQNYVRESLKNEYEQSTRGFYSSDRF